MQDDKVINFQRELDDICSYLNLTTYKDISDNITALLHKVINPLREKIIFENPQLKKNSEDIDNKVKEAIKNIRDRTAFNDTEKVLGLVETAMKPNVGEKESFDVAQMCEKVGLIKEVVKDTNVKILSTDLKDKQEQYLNNVLQTFLIKEKAIRQALQSDRQQIENILNKNNNKLNIWEEISYKTILGLYKMLEKALTEGDDKKLTDAIKSYVNIQKSSSISLKECNFGINNYILNNKKD